MVELFDKHGGFRRLHSFTLATIIQIEDAAVLPALSDARRARGGRQVLRPQGPAV